MLPIAGDKHPARQRGGRMPVAALAVPCSASCPPPTQEKRRVAGSLAEQGEEGEERRWQPCPFLAECQSVLTANGFCPVERAARRGVNPAAPFQQSRGAAEQGRRGAPRPAVPGLLELSGSPHWLSVPSWELEVLVSATTMPQQRRRPLQAAPRSSAVLNN